MRILLAAADDNGRRFGNHCHRRTSPTSIKHRGHINFNLLNLLNHFDSFLVKIMHKAAHPSGGVGSSNPHRLRGWRLLHHGDGVC
jgi:hypothetical protein